MRPSVAATAALLASVRADTAVHTASCRNLPGDASWPSAAAWSALNSTVQGRLIATVPIGTPCHDPHYKQATCAALQTNWPLPQTQFVYT